MFSGTLGTRHDSLVASSALSSRCRFLIGGATIAAAAWLPTAGDGGSVRAGQHLKPFPSEQRRFHHEFDHHQRRR
jgi:hypothetical protein